ncbi:MAG: hypothetical protein ACYC2P_09385 [Paludibacteraceae bacterium]
MFTNQELLVPVTQRAKKSLRMRMNFNFYESPDVKKYFYCIFARVGGKGQGDRIS